MAPAHTRITRSESLNVCILGSTFEDALARKTTLQGAERCFKDQALWYMLNVGYSNPYCVDGSSHAELRILEREIHIAPSTIIADTMHLLFYGIGTGDSEMAFVQAQLMQDQKNVFVTGIDVNRNFLEQFSHQLRMASIEHANATINYQGICAKFDDVAPADLTMYMNSGERMHNAHIIVGQTIGNFADQHAVYDMFSRRSVRGDALVIGFQSPKYFDTLFEKYANNLLYPDFILHDIPVHDRTLEWKKDIKNHVLSASYHGEERFRTTRYDPEELRRALERHGYALSIQLSDGVDNVYVQRYVKQ